MNNFWVYINTKTSSPPFFFPPKKIREERRSNKTGFQSVFFIDPKLFSKFLGCKLKGKGERSIIKTDT